MPDQGVPTQWQSPGVLRIAATFLFALSLIPLWLGERASEVTIHDESVYEIVKVVVSVLGFLGSISADFHWQRSIGRQIRWLIIMLMVSLYLNFYSPWGTTLLLPSSMFYFNLILLTFGLNALLLVGENLGRWIVPHKWKDWQLPTTTCMWTALTIVFAICLLNETLRERYDRSFQKDEYLRKTGWPVPVVVERFADVAKGSDRLIEHSFNRLGLAIDIVVYFLAVVGLELSLLYDFRRQTSLGAILRWITAFGVILAVYVQFPQTLLISPDFAERVVICVSVFALCNGILIATSIPFAFRFRVASASHL